MGAAAHSSGYLASVEQSLPAHLVGTCSYMTINAMYTHIVCFIPLQLAMIAIGAQWIAMLLCCPQKLDTIYVQCNNQVFK